MQTSPPLSAQNRNAPEVHADQELLKRENLGASTTIPQQSTLISGIGGHEAVPNSRLFSYILPAADLASHGASNGQKPSLLLTTSLHEKAKDDPKREHIEVNTLAKLELLRRFIHEFLSQTFQKTELYFGSAYAEVDPSRWAKLWDGAIQVDPTIDADAQEKIRRWKVPGEKLISYAVQHALWFRDVCSADDPELSHHSEDAHVSIGGRHELFFNKIRTAVAQLPSELLSRELERDVTIHDRASAYSPRDKQLCTVRTSNEKKGWTAGFSRSGSDR